MRGIPGSAILIFLSIILLIELIAFFSMRKLIVKPSFKKLFAIIYWSISVAILGLWISAFINPESIRDANNYRFFYFVIAISIFNTIPKIFVCVFFLFSLIPLLLQSKYWHKIILMSSLIIALGIMSSIGFGILFGRKMVRVEEVNLTIKELPKSLDGLVIVQLSDIHLASFENADFLERSIEIVNEIGPDIILFTGDLVNNYYSEIIGFEDELSSIKARYGKFAILGNHDYGDYSNWESAEAKKADHDKLCSSIEGCGFDLLLNETVELQIADTSIFIIGVENWGHSPFPQYADLSAAIEGVPQDAFKILMSHDPAHWEAKVLPETNIPLTLSGHTHGAQTGFRIAGIEFSPMFLVQKYWGGLYQSGSRYLYVNRGFGCVGLLGRIDMVPEITVLRLRSDTIEIDRN